MKGELFTVVTDFDTYFVEVHYNRQTMCYMVRVYRLPPEVELDLPIPFRFLKIPIEWMVQKIAEDPLIQRTYSVSKVRDPRKAVMYTLFAYEFPFFMEKKIRGMEKQVHYDYEALAKEYFERNKKQNQLPRKKIDWSKVPVHDYLEMEE
jgi:hypothetical protein